ncbi:MAG TPA: DNA-3-methyladenine glycosylase [Firmicutes bacterium]|nr:DNA-3-methyladenine glycosylase [Bacillota bacterium]
MQIEIEKRFPLEFFTVDAVTLARRLLGALLVRRSAEGITAGMIVETEAYRGPDDRAAHSCSGRRTSRTEVMFGPGGRAYVYLIYGMYLLFNVVAAKEGQPEAVLIRALEPVLGLELMAGRRGLELTTDQNPPGDGERGPERLIRSLCNGPGRLTRALDITRQHYGIDLRGDELFLVPYKEFPEAAVATTPRINVDYAGEWKHMPWRFVVRDSPFLSTRRHL